MRVWGRGRGACTRLLTPPDSPVVRRPQIKHDMDTKAKRDLYGQLLNHVKFDAGPSGSHSLELTAEVNPAAASNIRRTPRGKERNPEDYDTVDDILFNQPGEDSHDLTESQLMTPQIPGGDRSQFLNDRNPPPSPITDPTKRRPKSTQKRRRRPKTTSSRMRTSKSEADMNSRTQPLPRISTPGRASKTVYKEIAGYKPPTDLSHLNDDLLERAKGLKDNPGQLMKLLKKEVFVLAANRVGVDVEELKPRTTISFRTGPTPMAKLRLMHKHYDNRRVLNIALVLMEMDKADDLLRQRDKIQEDYVKTIVRCLAPPLAAPSARSPVPLPPRPCAQLRCLTCCLTPSLPCPQSAGFFDTLKQERRRIRNIRVNRRKIEAVAETENELLVKAREEFNERMERAERRHQELQAMRAQQKEYLARRSAERQQEILRVQVQKEEREAERLRQIKASHEQRNNVLERHRQSVRCAGAPRVVPPPPHTTWPPSAQPTLPRARVAHRARTDAHVCVCVCSKRRPASPRSSGWRSARSSASASART